MNEMKWYEKTLPSDEIRVILKKGETVLNRPNEFLRQLTGMITEQFKREK